ncbi:hypothetical protein [Mesorhizobium shangrilense]|uniref:DNA alkylation repair protein n=1 Tax=Mesorhizobium shangrilense TaxID=460060 RepID=A0ABV2D754_9HYPH
MEPDAELQRLIDDCYEAFADYPRPRALHASPLRDPVEILKTLTSAPLRQLTDEQIGPYAGYALTTVGGVDDYKHFLPRILELAINDPPQLGIDPPIVAHKLGRAQWLQWPASEQEPIRTLFAAAWRHAVQQHPDEVDPHSWLCAIAILGQDLPAALEAWPAVPSPNAGLQAVHFVTMYGASLFKDNPDRRGFWSYVDEQTIETMRQWLLGEAAFKLLSSASGPPAPVEEWKLDEALSILAACEARRR